MNSKNIIIDNENGKELVLDKDNDRFFKAFELVKKNGSENIFITGKASTGKTTFLKYVKKNIKKNIAIVAYTGIAAINAGGQTIHSFFKIDPNEAPFTPWDKRLRYSAKDDSLDKTTIFSHFQYNTSRIDTLKALEILIIDEVSMVRADFIDVIDKILRAFGKQRNLPFGGVKIILIGDTFQLPPIEGKEWQILNQFYESPFFFSAKSISENLLIQIELDKIYRQNEIDFINVLNRIRINQPTELDIQLLNNKVRPISNSDFDQNYIVLCSTNPQVNEINLQRLFNLNSKEFEYIGAITDIFPKSACVTEIYLRLKEGAQVMFLKNGPNYYNGKIGTVKKLENDKIVIEVKNEKGDTSEVSIGMHTWENVTFNYNKNTKEIERKVVGTFKQYPIKLAWAITIHKSQGLTFEKVIININDFTPSGSTYVALSRCTSLNGLVLNQPIYRKAINTDTRVIEYAKKVAPDSLIIELLNEGKADEFYKESRDYFKKGNFEVSFMTLLKAIKYRNDTETSSFKKFIKVQFEKLIFYKSFYNTNIKILEETKKSLAQKELLITNLENRIFKLDQSTSDLKRSTSDFKKLNAEIQQNMLLLSEENEKNKNIIIVSKEAHERSVKLSSKLEKEMKAEVNSLNDKLKAMTNMKVAFENLTNNLKNELTDAQNEIVRLNDLTWFDKIRGKK